MAIIEPDSVDSPNIQTILEDVEQLKSSVKKLEAGLAKNTALTEQVASNTSDVVDAFRAASGAFKVLEYIGKAARPMFWLISVVAGGTALWTSIKNSAVTWFK